MDFCRWLSCLHILVTRTFLPNFIGKTYCWHVFNFICLLSVPFLLILSLYLICFLCFFSRKKLARRLLFDRSANDEHERSILSKLKQQCGGQFTSKMEGMVSWPGYLDNVCQSVHATVVIDCLFFFQVTDLQLAKEHQSSFDEYLGNNPTTRTGIDLQVSVLTTGYWPSYKSSDINLPGEMVKIYLDKSWQDFSVFVT